MFKLVVLTCVLAVASANVVAPLGWAAAGWGGWAGNGLAAPWAAPLAASWATPAALAGGVAAAPVLGAYNYRGPLSLAPGQPANILAADGRPLDTLSVNLDRAAHITAKTVEGSHILRKRSAVLPAVAPVAWSRTAGLTLPLAAPLAAAPLAVAPLAAAPLTAAPLAGAWGAAPLGYAAAWGAPRW